MRKLIMGMSVLCIMLIAAPNSSHTDCAGLIPSAFAGPVKQGGKCAKNADCGIGLLCRKYRCVDPEKAKKKAADSFCRTGKACKQRGLCTDRGGRCIATSSKDCKASIRCRWHGECRASGSECKALTNTDCRRSKGCKEWGRCHAKDGICESR